MQHILRSLVAPEQRTCSPRPATQGNAVEAGSGYCGGYGLGTKIGRCQSTFSFCPGSSSSQCAYSNVSCVCFGDGLQHVWIAESSRRSSCKSLSGVLATPCHAGDTERSGCCCCPCAISTGHSTCGRRGGCTSNQHASKPFRNSATTAKARSGGQHSTWERREEMCFLRSRTPEANT